MNLVAVTPGFCNWQTLAHSWDRLYTGHHLDGWRHYFIDCHYPLRRGSNLDAIRRLCVSLGVQGIDVGADHGQAGNFNRALPLLGLDRGAYLAGIDPDAFIDGPPDTLLRAAQLLEANPHLAWVSLELPCTRPNAKSGCLRGAARRTCPATKLTYLEPRRDQLDMIDVSVWRASFLLDVGGLRQEYAYYGAAEIPMVAVARAKGLNYAYLLDHRSACCRDFVDPEYVQWKADHLAGFPGSMAEWLTRKPSPVGSRDGR